MFFLYDTLTTETYTYEHTLSRHGALPIWPGRTARGRGPPGRGGQDQLRHDRRRRVLRRRLSRGCGGRLSLVCDEGREAAFPLRPWPDLYPQIGRAHD